MSPDLLYFAYGSNMLPARLHERVGDCERLGAARLSGYRLAFHKRGRDGSGKCDLVPAGAEVHGVVFRIHRTQKSVLDRHEGVGRGYRIGRLPLLAGGVRLDAFAYLAEPDHIDPAIEPFDWYRALVLQGAREAGLPATYCAGIAAVPARADPDPERAARAWHLLHPGTTG